MLVFMLLLGCGKKTVASYDTGLFKLASGFSAKEMCSCVFVLERDEAFCGEWTRVSPNIAGFKVDHELKTVRSKALGTSPRTARYVDAKTGCILE